MKKTDNTKQQPSTKEPLEDVFAAMSIFAPISQNDLGSITPNPNDDKRNFGIVKR